LEERIGAYRKAGKTPTYFDQCKGLTAWRRGDREASKFPVYLQRATLKRLDEAYRAFFRRVQTGDKPGFPRFRGKGWFDSFGFAAFAGITLKDGRLRFKGIPGSLRVHWHRELPGSPIIKSCVFKRDVKCWSVGFAVEVPAADPRRTTHAVGADLGISTFAVLSDGGFIPSLRAARKAARRLRIAQRALSRQDCSSCGTRVPENLATRGHDCPACGSSMDRDLNEARNILNRAGVGPGLRNVAGYGMRAGGNLYLDPCGTKCTSIQTESHQITGA
jgi:putative transposase